MTGGVFFSSAPVKAPTKRTDRPGRALRTRPAYLPECQVMKFLGDFENLHTGQWWRCFTTGRQGWVLFAMIDGPGGIATGLQFSYPRKAFKCGVLPRER